jgi:hypothetical protein
VCVCVQDKREEKFEKDSEVHNQGKDSEMMAMDEEVRLVCVCVCVCVCV